MGKNLEITYKLEKYIEKFSYQLTPVQREIIKYNYSLGDIKRMQIAVSQCHFLHLIIKTSKIKNVLEIGTFTGLSALSIAIALPIPLDPPVINTVFIFLLLFQEQNS